MDGHYRSRINDALLSRSERRLLDFTCARLPRAIDPDHLTALGFLGGILVFTGFLASNVNPAFLWLAAAGIVLNWAGDSLDGSLARHRRCERPRYGFYLDHMVDGFTMALIGLGAGLSPALSMASCIAVVCGYLLLTVLSLLEAQVLGSFRISYARLGPTEFRLFLLALIAVIYFHPVAQVSFAGKAFSVYDLLLWATAASLAVTCLSCFMHTLHMLARQDPPRRGRV